MTDPAGGPRPRGGLRSHLRTVRVRITVTAAVVTAVAVGAAGWLLVRSVEDTQFSRAREEINAELERVTGALEAGVNPDLAVQGSTWSPWVLIQDETGRVVAHRNTPSTVVNISSDAETQTSNAWSTGAGAPTEAPLPTPGSRELQVEIGVRDLPYGPAAGGTGPVAPGQVANPILGQPPDATEVQVGGIVTRFTSITEAVQTPSGTMTVSAATPVEQAARGVEALRRALVVGVPALVLLVALIAWTLVGRALRPVEAIRTEVEGITGTTMHRRVPEPPTGDEIGRLARTMNAMLGRLDRAAARQREFVADASHELRSPIATIRTRLEVARSNPEGADWPTVADKVLAEEARLEALIDDMLLLAAQEGQRAGARNNTPGDGRTSDLAAIVRDEAERPRRIPVTVRTGRTDSTATADTGPPAHDGAPGPPPTTVPGDPDRLERVVANLLDNAARHAASTVEVRVENIGDRAHLSVDDDGPGIPEADRERVFERFTRLDHSRARDRGGAGLGLAVVRSVVTGRGGQVRTEESPLGGARFVVDLPLAD